MTQQSPTARFAREWNFAFLVVAAGAGVLLAAGYAAAGAIAAGLCMTAIAARYSAMRKQNRGFYGREKRPR